MKNLLFIISICVFSSTAANALTAEETSVQKPVLTEEANKRSAIQSVENESALKLIDNLTEKLYNDRMKKWRKEQSVNLPR